MKDADLKIFQNTSAVDDQTELLLDMIERFDRRIGRLEAALRVVLNEAPPCTCHKAYKGRGLIDPNCMQCNGIDRDIITLIKELLES